MSGHSLNHRLTEIEDQTLSEVAHRFADHCQQFPASRDLINRLEHDIAKIALAACVVSQKASSGIPIVTDDGAQWYKSVSLSENIFVCHRQIAIGPEFAVVEHFPSGTNEIWMRGRNAIEVLKAFTYDQRQALQIWKEDLAAHVREFLAEKYPGQDMNRVADTFIFQYAQSSFSQKQSPSQNLQEPLFNFFR